MIPAGEAQTQSLFCLYGPALGPAHAGASRLQLFLGQEERTGWANARRRMEPQHCVLPNTSGPPFPAQGAEGCSGSDFVTGIFMPTSHHTHTLHTQGPGHAEEGLGKHRLGHQGLLC